MSTQEKFNLTDREIKIKDKGSIKKGFFSVILAHIIFMCIIFIYTKFNANTSLVFCIQFLWLIQIIYAIPMTIYFRKEEETLKGILIASGTTFLLCCGICGVIGFPVFK